VGSHRSGKVYVVIIGALIIAVVIVFALPIAFLMSGTLGAMVMGWMLKDNAEATHPGSELIDTNF
jgi:cytochrome b subunit of formate dehydrogenase